MDGSMSERDSVENMRAEKMAALRAMERERDGGMAGRQEALASALSRIADHLENLEQRLQPVLMDPEPTQALHATPRMPMSPLGGFLTGATGHAEELAQRISNLMQRVDL